MRQNKHSKSTGLHRAPDYSQEGCQVIDIDQLPGGTAEDYELHIVESTDRVADVYCAFHNTDFDTCWCNIIFNVTNAMTDRAAVNHATILLLRRPGGQV